MDFSAVQVNALPNTQVKTLSARPGDALRPSKGTKPEARYLTLPQQLCGDRRIDN
ncbi:hypothetical protein [Glutamicibacter sp. NPDC087344]|uniref:hypothetical protein n=1 Tax=Glutamicibacter sp. NPDC087344 TaxID=3363994 RepID=UPI003800B9FD